jgi:hypothetical protein
MFVHQTADTEDNSTYVVVAILRQKRNPLTGQLTLRLGSFALEIILGRDNIGN